MHTNTLLLSAALALTAQMTSLNVQAEILAIGANAEVLKKANLPTLGDTMEAVRETFGTAENVSVSKGKVTTRNPKITRWDYPDFSVFFENTHVIHSVVSQ